MHYTAQHRQRVINKSRREENRIVAPQPKE
jgi:hypothetical protein